MAPTPETPYDPPKSRVGHIGSNQGIATAFLLSGSISLCLGLGAVFYGVAEISGTGLAQTWFGRMDMVYVSFSVLVVSMAMFWLAFILIRRGTRIVRADQASVDRESARQS